MAYVVSSPIYSTIVLRDAANAALTGKTSADFTTIEAYRVSAPTTTATATLTEIGDGEYSINFTPSTESDWAAHVVYDSGGVFREWIEVFDVVGTDDDTANYPINEAINDMFSLRDTLNAAITGATTASFATAEAYLISVPATTATVTITEIGSGEYHTSFTPTAAGDWVLHLVYDTGGVFGEWAEEYRVASVATAAPGVTLKFLRRAIADKLNDIIVLTASAAGADSTIIDEENLTDSDNAYRSAFVKSTGGTTANRNLIRRVSTSQQSSTSVTLLTSLDASTAVGDEFEMVRLRGIGHRFQDYTRVINEAIGMLRDGEYVVRSIEYVTDTFDETDPLITIPAVLTWVDRVQYQDDEGDWFDIPRARVRDANGIGWAAEGLTGTVRVAGEWRYEADGRSVRAWGYSDLEDLEADTDTTPAPTEFIVYWGAHVLALKMGGPEWTPKAMLFRDLAMSARPKSSIPWGPSVVRVRA